MSMSLLILPYKSYMVTSSKKFQFFSVHYTENQEQKYVILSVYFQSSLNYVNHFNNIDFFKRK